MNTTCLIIDDEPLAINVIENHLSKIKGIEVVGTFTNAVESLEYLRERKVDLLFLDINMPILDGFSFLKSLEEPPVVIITTAHAEFAAQSYELEVLDYLIKPIPFPRFLQAVNKALSRLKDKDRENRPSEREYIFVKIDSKKMKKVYLDEIQVVESLKDYIKIITLSNRYIVHQTLTSFTKNLPESKFLRIHRSYTIAIDKIEAIEGNTLEIAGIRYVIGRSYANEVKEKILNLSKF